MGRLPVRTVTSDMTVSMAAGGRGPDSATGSRGATPPDSHKPLGSSWSLSIKALLIYLLNPWIHLFFLLALSVLSGGFNSISYINVLLRALWASSPV